jgi:hypothetical protein
MEIPMTLLEAAQAYAERGWPVFPIVPRAKKPLTPKGFHDATTDPHQIEAWWARWPNANIGIATGGPGPTVLDIDDLRHDTARAAMTFLAINPPPSVVTGRGRHFYFAGSGEPTTVLSYGEVRGVGGYVLVPPSMHPAGGRYAWHDDPGALLVARRRPLTPLPPWVFNARRSDGPGTGVVPPFEPVPPGHMHDFLADRAVRLVGAGFLSVEELTLILLAEFNAAKLPGVEYLGDERDTRRLAAWAAGSDIARRERGENVSSAGSPYGGKISTEDSSSAQTPSADRNMPAPLIKPRRR